MYPYNNFGGFQSQQYSNGYQFQNQNQQQQQPQANGGFQSGFQPQPTGFQPQPTGFASQQTGFQPQQTGFQTGFQSQPTGFQSQPFQPQATGFQSQQPFMQSQATGFGFPGTTFLQQPAQQPLVSQPTGFQTYNETFLVAQPTGFAAKPVNDELKLPNIRLSFVTMEQQQKYEKLFLKSVPKGERAISAEAARKILLKSKLPAETLSKVWALADTNKAGLLLFPEFVLALHLCNVVLHGDKLPVVLPPKIKNEVTSYVDSISFSIPDTSEPKSNNLFSDFGNSSGQKPSNGLLQLNPTGFQQQQQPVTSFQAQPTGGFQPQFTGMQPQFTGFQPQATGIQPQNTGFQPPITSFQPQMTGIQPQQTGLMSQPTGQIGLVPQKTGIVTPGLQALQNQFIGNNYSQNFSLNSNQVGNVNNEVLTKSEIKIFSDIFKQHAISGYLDGPAAIEVFSKSRLARPDLEQIWTLADTTNRGKLTREEFIVAMKLIYNRLAGMPIPLRLPPELVPQSSKIIEDVKSSIKSYSSVNLKSKGKGTSDAARFKNDDDDIQYSSSARHRRPSASSSSVNVSGKGKELISQLKKSIHEKEIVLQALDAEDDKNSLDFYKQQKQDEVEIDNLKRRIADVQNDISKIPDNNNSFSASTFETKDELLRKLNYLTAKVPDLIANIQATDKEINSLKIDLFKADLLKKNPNSSFGLNNIDPNDKKAVLRARISALTNKNSGSNSNDLLLSNEINRLNQESLQQQQIIGDIESGIRDLESGLEQNLRAFYNGQDQVGFEKWEKGVGVSPKVQSFIFQLSENASSQNQVSITNNQPTYNSNNQSREFDRFSPSPVAEQKVPPPVAKKPSYSGKTPEERAAFIKEQAAIRMRERLAKFGLSSATISSPSSSTSSLASPKPEPVSRPARAAPPAPPKRAPQAQSAQPESQTAQPDSESSDDEEYQELLKEKQRMEKEREEQERQRQEQEKLQKEQMATNVDPAKKERDEKRERKRREKEERLRKLKEEMRQLKAGSSSPQPPATNGKAVSEPISSPLPPQAEPVTQQAPPPSQTHGFNPFAKQAVPQAVPSAPTPASNNPFFRPPPPVVEAKKEVKEEPKPQPSSFDINKAISQRHRRPSDSDDDWGDDDDGKDDDNEEDHPIRSKDGNGIASLLFGGAPGSSTPPVQSTPTPTPVSAPSAPPAPSVVPNSPEIAPVEAPPSPAASDASSLSIPDSVDSFEDALDKQTSQTPSIPPPAPPLPSGDAPPAPPLAPPVPAGFAPPIPQAAPPAPPPLPPTGAPNGIPPPPPPPPVGDVQPMAPAATGPPPGQLNALFAQITGGKSLKSVPKEEMHIHESSGLGKVL